MSSLIVKYTFLGTLSLAAVLISFLRYARNLISHFVLDDGHSPKHLFFVRARNRHLGSLLTQSTGRQATPFESIIFDFDLPYSITGEKFQ